MEPIAALSVLKSFISKKKDPSALCTLIAESISQFVKIDDFYMLDNQAIINILESTGELNFKTAKTFIEYSYRVNGITSIGFLPYIKVGELGFLAREILGPLLTVPLLRELSRPIENSISAFTDIQLPQKRPDSIDIDFEYLYQESLKEIEKLRSEIAKQAVLRAAELSISDRFVEREHQKPQRSKKRILRTYGDPEEIDNIDSFIESGRVAKPHQKMSSAIGSALSEAILAGDSAASSLLFKHISKGVRIPPNDFLPLALACERSNSDVVAALLENGADPNERNVDGNTPLMYAASNSEYSPEITQILLAAGARPSDTNYFRSTAMHFAAVYGQPDTIRILRESGANARVVDEKGRTPSQLALDSRTREALFERICRDKNAKRSRAASALI